MRVEQMEQIINYRDIPTDKRIDILNALERIGFFQMCIRDRYKKLDAALKAAAKDESLVVWDETGKVIGSLTDDVPEGALQTNPDGSVNTYDADGRCV